MQMFYLKRFYYWPVWLILFLFFINIGYAQSQDQPETVYLTMEEAISMALARNNQVKATEYGLMQAKWNIKNAWGQMLPSVHLSTRYTWIDDSTFALRDFSRYFQDPASPFGFNIPQTVFQDAFFTSIDINMHYLMANYFTICLFQKHRKKPPNFRMKVHEEISFSLLSVPIWMF